MSTSPLRLGFVGTPDLAAAVLQALLGAEPCRIELVLTRPDRATGRGRQLRGAPVKTLAERHGLTLKQPADAQELAEIQGLQQLDLLVVVAYGMLLPAQVLQQPRLGAVNLHLSYLPRWRGATPVQHAILNGDRQTGVSVMQMDETLDTGPLLRQARLHIGQTENCAQLQRRLTALGSNLLLQTLDELRAGTACPRSQDAQQASYAPHINKAQAHIRWSEPAQAIDRAIRAFNPAPIAHTRLQSTELRIWQAMLPAPEPTAARPGTVIAAGSEGIEVAAGDGRAVRLLQVQSPGKRVLSAAAFLNGRPAFRVPRRTPMIPA